MSQGSPKILILEDEALILMDLAFAVEDLGATVVKASNPRQALAAIKEQAIDAAILDVNLGTGQDCADVADELARRGTPFVLHSGDLDRKGELIRKINAPILRKPMLASAVAEATMKLVGAPA
jgi:CheY-like chemotaxis protein